MLYLRNFFTDCFEILTQPCIPIRACFYIPIIYMSHRDRYKHAYLENRRHLLHVKASHAILNT
jgi:hypothetical protein